MLLAPSSAATDHIYVRRTEFEIHPNIAPNTKSSPASSIVDVAGWKKFVEQKTRRRSTHPSGLGRVIGALVDVPVDEDCPYCWYKIAINTFSESKLTQLQDSLGGRTKTFLMATISVERSDLVGNPMIVY